MGTSSSNPGPADTTPLLPDWATGPVDVDADGVPESDEPDGDGEEVGPDTEPDRNGGGEDSAEDRPHDGMPEGTQRPWQLARRRMTAVVSGGGGQQSIRRAGSAYVAAKGGSRQAARQAVSGRQATGRLAGFLSDVARHGFEHAVEGLGLKALVGKDAETVFAAIVDTLAPDGASEEEAAARYAMAEVLWQLYDQLSLDDGNLGQVDEMSAESVAAAIESSIVAYVYTRWLQEVGIKIEERSPTAAEAVRRERDVRNYIQEEVRLDLSKQDVLSTDWGSTQAERFIESLYADVYDIFGEE